MAFLRFLIKSPVLVGLLSGLLVCLTGCADTFARLGHLGAPPPLYPVVNPAERAEHIRPPQTIPAPTLVPAHNNSLWQTGAKAFLKDQRASCVGDIVRIQVKMEDHGEFKNITNTDRQSNTQTLLPKVSGLENKMTQFFPKGADPASLIDTSHITQFKGGKGGIERSETVNFMVPALVVQVLPNGHLMIQGSQEIRLGQDVRTLLVQGILRPEDIDVNNSAPAERLTEARLFYGGQGDLSDLQRPRYGTQALDILSPF